MVALLLCIAMMLMPRAATADFGVVPGSFIADAFDQAGQPFTQAGGHPHTLETRFMLGKVSDGRQVLPDGNLKDLEVRLPPGLVGNPRDVPTCSREAAIVQATADAVSRCPIDSQIGVAYLRLISFGVEVYYRAPIYNMAPDRGEAAAFLFMVVAVPVRLSATVDPVDGYALRVRANQLNETLAVTDSRVVFWGTPADPSHDLERGTAELGYVQPDGSILTDPIAGRPSPTSAPLRPFMTNPTDCAHGPFRTRLAVSSWQAPSQVLSYDAMTSSGVTGCDRLRFEPVATVRPTTALRDQPTGLVVDLRFPQYFTVPAGVESPPLKDVTMRLPEGMSINPGSADGLGSCSDDQLRLASEEPAACPAASKIGTVEATTPLLHERLAGGIFLRPQASSDPESGDLFRIALVLANAERGISVRLPGSIRVDQQTGQIEAEFENNPQLPVSTIRLAFKTGPRAPLSTPLACGSHQTTGTLTSWGGPTARIADSFEVECPGAAAFGPVLAAGVREPVAGRSSAFTLRFSRGDGQPEIVGMTAELPRGLTATVADVDLLCPEPQASFGTCPAGSRIGSVTVASGPGLSPLHLPGEVFLTRSHRGMPFGLSIVVPAVAGPFNLGTVVVRAAIAVDERDARLTVVTDPLPWIHKGVHLRLRSATVRIDRDGFMLNPTSCAPARISAGFVARTQVRADRAVKFQVGDCAALSFKPRMALRVGARRRTAAGVTTPLEATLSMAPGQANVRRVQVKLPRSLNSRLDVISARNGCSLEQYRATRCPISVGSAVAVTPLLREPMQGKVYLVRTPVRRLPDMMVALRGQGDAALVRVDLTGKVRITRDLAIRTTFDDVPDVPITKFSLRLAAGRNGAIGVVENLCRRKTRRGMVARLAFTGQNGKALAHKQRVTVSGCAKPRVGPRGTRPSPPRRRR